MKYIDMHMEMGEELEIEGINTKAGIMRVANNENLYLDLLKRFTERYENVVEQLIAYRRAREFSQLEYLAHSIKGACGNIGAEKLYHAFTELEKQAKNHSDENTYIILEEIAIEMNKIIHSINKVLMNPVNFKETPHASVSKQQLGELINCLEQGNNEAIELWDELKGGFRTKYGISKEQTIEMFIRNYCFDETIQYLKDLQNIK